MLWNIEKQKELFYLAVPRQNIVIWSQQGDPLILCEEYALIPKLNIKINFFNHDSIASLKAQMKVFSQF
jgi:hypothetical protein